MDKLIKAKKAALTVLGISAFMLVVGILGSSLAVYYGQNASGYAVIALIPIGLFGIAYAAYMLKNIAACVNVLKGVQDGKSNIDELSMAKTDAAKRNTEKVVKQCIEEGLLDGYTLSEDGELVVDDSANSEALETVCEETMAESADAEDGEPAIEQVQETKESQEQE